MIGRGIGLCLVIVLGACASIEVIPPEKKEFDRSRVYVKPFDETWTRAVDWFADHNVIIEKIEKQSGLLTAKYALETSSTYLDCGQIKESGTLGKTVILRQGSLNVTVRPEGEAKSRVNVNFFGEFELRTSDAWDRRPVLVNGKCISTGELEKSILDYIAK